MILAAVDIATRTAHLEALALLNGKSEFALDVRAIADRWRRDERLLRPGTSAAVANGTVNDAMEQGIPAPVLSLALMLALEGQGTRFAAGGDAAPAKDDDT